MNFLFFYRNRLFFTEGRWYLEICEFVLGGNLAAKIGQKPIKNVGGRHSILGLVCTSFFSQFLVSTSSPKTFKIMVFPMEK